MTTENITVGSFGRIKAGIVGYKKNMCGFVVDKDQFGNITFKDDYKTYRFSPEQIDDFTELEFTELSEKYFWRGGELVDVATRKVVEGK